MYNLFHTLFLESTKDAQLKFFSDCFIAVGQALVVLAASFVFPATQSFFSARSQKRRDSIARKERILHEFTSGFPKYLANYIMYAKFCSFSINKSRETYLGMTKDKGADILFKSLSNTLDIQQPESLITSINTYYTSSDVLKLTASIAQDIDKLRNIPFNDANLECDCDLTNENIMLQYDKLIQAMALELKNNIIE